MTETQTKTDTTINDLKAAVRSASAEERALALETDAMPEKIQQAAREDARRQARAAREGGTGAQVAEAAQESEIPALRERRSSLPYLRWSAGIKTASLEQELYDLQVKHHKAEKEIARSGLEGLKMDAEAATEKYNRKLKDVAVHEGAAGRMSSYRAEAAKRLRVLEASMPGV